VTVFLRNVTVVAHPVADARTLNLLMECPYCAEQGDSDSWATLEEDLWFRCYERHQWDLREVAAACHCGRTAHLGRDGAWHCPKHTTPITDPTLAAS
jgi:hypothetical protein